MSVCVYTSVFKFNLQQYCIVRIISFFYIFNSFSLLYFYFFILLSLSDQPFLLSLFIFLELLHERPPRAVLKSFLGLALTAATCRPCLRFQPVSLTLLRLLQLLPEPWTSPQAYTPPACALVSCRCYNYCPQSQGLEKHMFIVLLFWRSESTAGLPGAGRAAMLPGICTPVSSIC